MRHENKVLLLGMHGMGISISAKIKGGNLALMLLLPEGRSSFLSRVHLHDTFNPYDPQYLHMLYFIGLY